MKTYLRVAMSVVLLSTLMPPAGRSATVKLPASTPVIVKLVDAVSSGTHKRGDKIKFEVVSDVLIDGKKVIAAGAPAEGEVENASKRFFAGIGGQLDITVQSATAVNGTVVPLQFKKGAHDGSSVLPIVLGVICCICVLLFPGKDVVIEKGSIFNATTVGPMEFNL